MGDQTFPTTLEGRHTYYDATVPYMTTHKTRLGISTQAMTDLNTILGDDVTPDTYYYVWKKYIDPVAGHTDTVIVQLNSLDKAVRKQISKIYNDIPDSLWTDADRTMFNRKTGLPHSHTHPSTPIEKECFAVGTAMGGGKVKIQVKDKEDSTRFSLTDGSDGFEVAYKSSPRFKAGAETASKVRAMITGPNDGTTKDISRSSKTMVQLDPDEDPGNELQYYTRWVNTRHRELDGPWTGPFTVMIS